MRSGSLVSRRGPWLAQELSPVAATAMALTAVECPGGVCHSHHGGHAVEREQLRASLQAHNEQAVALFLEEQIHFLDIPRLIDVVCDRHQADLTANPSLSDVLAVDAWARQAVREAAARLQAKAPAALPA